MKEAGYKGDAKGVDMGHASVPSLSIQSPTPNLGSKRWLKIGAGISFCVLGLAAIIVAVVLTQKSNSSSASNGASVGSAVPTPSPPTGGVNGSSLPNIIFILSDDLGYNDVGWANDDFKDLTPNLDALRNTGIDLQSYYSQALCTPSRAALLTGRYPLNTGMQTSAIEVDDAWGLPTQFPLISNLLKAYGYATHFIGKWHLGHAYEEQTPEYRGFDDSYHLLTGEAYYYAHTQPNDNVLDLSSASANSSSTCMTGLESNFSTQLYTDKALSYAYTWDKVTPMLLQLHYQDPHAPLDDHDLSIDYSPVQASLDLITDTDRLAVAKLVYGFDYHLNILMTGLNASGVLDNAIVVFVSDNGGCTSLGTSNYPLRGAKHHNWEGGNRVRGFLTGSAVPALSNRTVTPTGPLNYTNLFHVTDWLPTLMEAVSPGWSTSADALALSLDGYSHWAALQDETLAAPRYEMVYNIESETTRGRAPVTTFWGAIRQGDMKLLQREPCQGYYDVYGRKNDAISLAICGAEGFTQSECNTANESPSTSTHLYNITADPMEYTDLATVYPDIVATLEARLQEYYNIMQPAQKTSVTAPSASIPEAAYASKGCVSPFMTS